MNKIDRLIDCSISELRLDFGVKHKNNSLEKRSYDLWFRIVMVYPKPHKVIL